LSLLYLIPLLYVQVGDLAVGVGADVDVSLRFNLSRSADDSGQILALHLSGLYRHHILAALMNGETDNDCEQNHDAGAESNFFPGLHDSRHLVRGYVNLL